MRKIAVIAAWEYLERVKSRFFLVSLILMPLIMISLGILPAFLIGGETQTRKVIAVADLTGVLLPRFANQLTKGQMAGENHPSYIIRPLDVAATSNEEAVRVEGDQLVVSGEVDGFCILKESKKGRYTIEFRSASLHEEPDKGDLENALKSILLEDTLISLGVPPSSLEWLNESVMVEMVILSSKEGRVEETNLKEFLQVFFSAYVFLMMLFFMILSSGQLLVRSVVEEKANRIVEILVSACTPTQLMTGKMVGLSCLGFTQMLVWSAVALIMSSVLSLEFIVHEQLLLLLLYFVLGYLFYASIFIAVGSPVTTEQEAQQVTGYLVIFLVIPLVLTVPAIQDPGAEWISILSYIPLLTPTMMGLRLALGSPALSEILTTVAIMLVSIYISMLVAGRIFRIAILSTGKRPTMRELISWVRTGA